MIRYYIVFLLTSSCNTVSNTVEGVSRGVYKDVKTIHHYSTCVFTSVQCGDLDLKTSW
jgi:hypothetical protein